MNDLISRQAAIDALGERPMVWTDDDHYALGERNQYDMDKLAIETVPSAQPEQRWIPCSERLPEESGQVLAYGAGEIFMAYFDADFHDGAWFKYFLNDDCQDPYLDPYFGEIRCWMPLPEPYEETTKLEDVDANQGEGS